MGISGSFSMVLHGTERREFSMGIVNGTVACKKVSVGHAAGENLGLKR